MKQLIIILAFTVSAQAQDSTQVRVLGCGQISDSYVCETDQGMVFLYGIEGHSGGILDNMVMQGQRGGRDAYIEWIGDEVLLWMDTDEMTMNEAMVNLGVARLKEGTELNQLVR